MTKTIKIYEINCYRAYMMSETGRGYGYGPWGADTRDYAGEDDGGHDYVVPAGLTVGLDATGYNDTPILLAGRMPVRLARGKTGVPVAVLDNPPNKPYYWNLRQAV